jgi:hypothetical protein
MKVFFPMWSAPILFARQLRGNTTIQQQRGSVFCAAWSVPQLYKGHSLKGQWVPEAHLTLNGRNISFMNHVKYLGVIFDKRITWRLHIEMIGWSVQKKMVVAYLRCPTIFLEELRKITNKYRLKIPFFWDITPAVLATCFSLVASLAYSPTLKTEATCSSKRRLTSNWLPDVIRQNFKSYNLADFWI